MKYLPAFVFLLLCVQTLHAEHRFVLAHQDDFDQANASLKKLVDSGQLDGVSIGVVNQQGLLWLNNFGFADREKDVRATEHTVYRSGSLSKLLTAAAILQLEEQGVIDIDQAASAYIPRFYYKTRFSEPGVITPRHLLAHLSGLPSNINKGHWSDERFSQLVERLRLEYAAYPTDFITNYSNVGYSLLGVILEENTDYLFEEYIRKHLFDPLGMLQSHFDPYGDASDHAARGYKNHIAQSNLPLRDIPAMGLNTSLADLSRFIQTLLNKGRYLEHQILSADSVAAMFSEQNGDVALDFDTRVGMPWFLSYRGRQKILTAEQGGTTINFSSQIVLAPDKKLGVIILSNTSQANKQIKQVAYTLLDHLVSNHHPVGHTQSVSTKPLPPLENSGNKQRYIAKSGIIEIDKGAQKLCDCQNQRSLNLLPLPDGWFGLSPDNRHFNSKIIEQEVDGNKVIVLQKNGNKHRIAASLKPVDNRFDWARHFGDYEIINPDENFPVTDVRIFNENNMTFICYRMPRLSDKLVVLPITPVSANEAITEGLGRSKGETIYSRHADGEDLLIYSGYIARKKKPR